MNRIKQLREEKKILQEELGNMLNLDKSQISRYESEKLDISTDALARMSEIFECSINYILGLDNNRKDTGMINDPYIAIIERAKQHKISPERLDRLIDFLTDEQKSK
jgi:transcriptional regulator with XRE-family HTH domain